MKSLIVYYSYSGNTKKVAEILKDYLKEKFEIDIVELKAKESDKFLVQAIRALKGTKAELQLSNFDLSPYDLVCLGTPVWAFGPAPAMNTFLDKCFGLENKNIILFCTYGSGLGKDRCLNHMQKILSKKGVKNFKKFSIQQFKVDNKGFILEKIKSLF